MKGFASILAIAAVTATSAAHAQRGSGGDVTVVAAGSGQTLRAGKSDIPRPFGAQLVDTLTVVGSQRVGGRDYTLVRGDATGECPSRYVVIYRARNGTFYPTTPFGSCAPDGRIRVAAGTVEVTMSAAAPGGVVPVGYRFVQGRMRPRDQIAAAANVATASSAPGSAITGGSLGCRAAGSVEAASQAAILDEFARDYPLDYRRFSTLKRTDITAGELRATVTALACLASWPGAERMVPGMATPLFASRRHGGAAFAELDRVAIDPQADANLRAVVRAFHAEMRYRVGRREPI